MVAQLREGKIVRLTYLAPLALSAVFMPCLAQTATAPSPAYLTDPKFVRAMNESKQLMAESQYGFALDALKKANKIAGGSCMPCITSIYDLEMGLHNYKDAVATAMQMEAAATDAMAKSVAALDRGSALVAQAGDKAKPAQLEAAHAAFEAALATYPENMSARYQDGCVLARMGKSDEASKNFTACADAASPADPMRQRARHFAENPALSMHKMAPAFEVTALDGTRFNLDNMAGRVVLIDFWATWCGPCNEELPHLQKLAREFAGEPLVILSISWDSDAQKWKDFIAKHEMTWAQYRDADHSLTERFGVPSIPHYFTIDSDGVLTGTMLGAEDDVEGKLKKLIKRAKEAQSTPRLTAQAAGME